MDGGRRLLRPVTVAFEGFQSSAPVYAGAAKFAPLRAEAFAGYGLRASERRAVLRKAGLVQILTGRVTSTCAALLLLAGVGLYGTWIGGEYSTFVAAEGSAPDYVARVLGFGIKTITISGAHALTEQKIIEVSGIDWKNSLPFLDAAKIRARLKALPLVRDASITKLYPGRVVIDIHERKPYALWQKDGKIEIVAADGTAIDAFKDPRFASLPLVVGAGANAQLDDYMALLATAGDLRPRIKAGILVAQRRWTLQMDNEIEVALPEVGAPAAVAELAQLERKYHLLEKDILSVDMRIPGKLIVRLSVNAAQERAAALAKKPKAKAART